MFESALLEFVGGDVGDREERISVVAKLSAEPGKIAADHPVISVLLQAVRHDRGSISPDQLTATAAPLVDLDRLNSLGGRVVRGFGTGAIGSV